MKKLFYILIILVLIGLILLGGLNVYHLKYYQSGIYGNCVSLKNIEIKKINFNLKQLTGDTKIFNYDIFNEPINSKFKYPSKNPYFSLITNKDIKEKTDLFTNENRNFACLLNPNDNTTYYYYSIEYANQLRLVLGLIIFPVIGIISIIIYYFNVERKIEKYDL